LGFDEPASSAAAPVQAQAATTPDVASSGLGYLRLLPAGGAYDIRNVPVWAHGMLVGRTDVQVSDENGIVSFVDTLAAPPTPFFVIVRAPADAVIGYVQAASVSETSTGGTTTITFGAGSLWLVAGNIDPSAPANAYAGLAFSTATLTVPGGLGVSIVAPEFNLPASTTATFSLAPAPLALSSSGLSNDGAASVATLPATVAFTLAPGGVSVGELDSATLAAYGETISLAAPGASIAASYDAAAFALTIPFAGTDAAQFTIAANVSPVLRIAGTAPIGGASYRIPVALTTPANLGPAATGGFLALVLGAGLRARWGNLGADVLAAGALLEVETGALQLTLTTTARPFTDTYALWDATATDGAVRATSIALTAPRGAQVVASQNSAIDAVVTIGCTIAANLDRPRTVDGSTARFDQLVAEVVTGRVLTGAVLVVLGAPKPPGLAPPPVRSESFALENALLRTEGIAAMLLSATLQGGRAAQGMLLTTSTLDALLPTLPDPYAATMSDAAITLDGQTLRGLMRWTSPSTVSFGFTLEHPTANALAGALAPALATRGGTVPLLFDVSGAADQFGVFYDPQALQTAGIIGQALAVGGDQSLLVTVPDVAWEPVLDADRSFFLPTSPDDGGPAAMRVDSVTLRPAEPRAFVDAFITDYAAGADLIASVTLPFGLTAQVNTASDAGFTPELRPALTENAPAFPAAALTGGAQLSIVGQTSAAITQAVLPGVSNADSAYAQALLDPTIASFWNQDFGGESPTGAIAPRLVPVERLDLSGYGLNMFSNWADASPDFDPGISHARFDVIAGRTSYEIVQAQSVIFPYAIRVVNTTIFARDDNGYVDRTNSGWQAKGPGDFVFPDATAPVELGGITGVYNVHNIRLIPGVTAQTGLKQWAAVTFDADVGLQSDAAAVSVNGASTIVVDGVTLPVLPSSGLTGWLDLTAATDPSLEPTFADALQLLSQRGSVGGPLAADAIVAGTSIGVTLTGIEVAATSGAAPAPTIGVAFATTPHLPRDGAWSIGRRASTASLPQPVDAQVPVPLVRAAAAPSTWHFADPADLHALDAPATLYSFIQGTGTQQILFEHPTVAPPAAGANPLNFVQTPKLADVGSLLGSSGLIPDLGSLLDFGNFSGFTAVGDGFGGQTLQNDVDLAEKELLSLGPIRVVLSSFADPSAPPPDPARPSHIMAAIDAAAPAGTPRWRVSITNVAFKLYVGAGDALITLSGDISAQDGSAPSFSPLRVDYGSLLNIVRSILEGIETFVEFLPDAGKSGIDVQFAGSQLKIREAFPIPQLPLGIGFLEGIALDLGFDVDVVARTIHFSVGVGSEDDPFHWLVSPLSGNGLLQLGATDTLGVDLQAGIGVGLGIDLAIVSGSASIVLAFRIDTTTTPFGVTVLLTGTAAVDVLDGLASVSLSLTAGLTVQVSTPFSDPLKIAADPIGYLKGTVVTLTAEVAVGVHITVGWFVHIDFDDSWPFSESISGKTLTALIP
jgi:hypothetical protein